MSVYGLGYKDISVAVPEGAANCRAACDELDVRSNVGQVVSSFETHVCDVHNLSRAVLHAVGQHGSKDNSKNPEVRKTLLKSKAISRKFSQPQQMRS